MNKRKEIKNSQLKENQLKKKVSECDDNFIMKPKVDFCFKELMQNENVRKGFIAAILGMSPDEIKETRLLPTHLIKHYSDDKLAILDVRVELNNKVQIDMEMQVGEFAYWTERSSFYLSKMFVEQMSEGNKYDILEKCIHIGIIDFELFPDDEEYYSRFHLREDSRNTLYTDKLEIHVIELPKVKKRIYPENDILCWTNFFNIESKKELDAMMNKNEYIDEACEQIMKISADDIKRIEYEERVKAIRDYNTQMKANYKKGIEKGKNQIYISLIKSKLEKGKSIEEIADEIELSVEEVKKFIAEINE